VARARTTSRHRAQAARLRTFTVRSVTRRRCLCLGYGPHSPKSRSSSGKREKLQLPLASPTRAPSLGDHTAGRRNRYINGRASFNQSLSTAPTRAACSASRGFAVYPPSSSATAWSLGESRRSALTESDNSLWGAGSFPKRRISPRLYPVHGRLQPSRRPRRTAHRYRRNADCHPSSSPARQPGTAGPAPAKVRSTRLRGNSPEAAPLSCRRRCIRRWKQ
jgi:hypothetical protein